MVSCNLTSYIIPHPSDIFFSLFRKKSVSLQIGLADNEGVLKRSCNHHKKNKAVVYGKEKPVGIQGY